jgi:hypothetical protein
LAELAAADLVYPTALGTMAQLILVEVVQGEITTAALWVQVALV